MWWLWLVVLALVLYHLTLVRDNGLQTGIEMRLARQTGLATILNVGSIGSFGGGEFLKG